MTRPMHQDATTSAAETFLRSTMVLLLLLLLMFSLSSFPSVTAGCPYKCSCKDELTVYCPGQGLDRIPDNIHPATKELYLTFNKFMDTESLAHLTELQSLDLGYNEIRNIESLAHLTELQILDLGHNNIRDIESLAHLTNLKSLNLEYNKVIEIGVFNNLMNLHELILNDNQIHKFDLEMFYGLTKLNTLDINHNPLKCDCNILLFVNALKKTLTQDTLVLTWSCNPFYRYPVEIHPKSLKEITENGFNCTSPDVIVVPENKTVLVGEQLQLSCKALGDPEPFITWAKDDNDLELGQRVQVLQNNTLIISKVERTDGGQYKCVASNFFGRKSFEAIVNVNGLAENGCNTMFEAIPGFFFIIILANCLLYNEIL
ncbi:unnamed protein product [Macrosiphum euphorbiae]|uniref:Ig-like domain-containing protein n=1 Tax=Macrosiphum euphorbiae TaxID=13131 RepID=A0AAV0WMD0_9HEMI|nr:unnamed protein product [Macrosiphum euphorbiae]